MFVFLLPKKGSPICTSVSFIVPSGQHLGNVLGMFNTHMGGGQ